MKDSRLPSIQSWTPRTSHALAHRLAQLAAERPALYQLFKRIESNLHIKPAINEYTAKH